MLFLAPVNTDAPLYHKPYGVFGILFLCCAFSGLAWFGVLGPWSDVLARYALAHGAGLHPWQWITSVLLHAGWLHLLINMFLLWGLGLVVEGKLGWERFVPLYLGLGVASSVLEQLALAWGAPGASCGASAANWGLVAIALLWAPKNDLALAGGVFLPPLIRMWLFELPILWFATVLLLIDVLRAVLVRDSLAGQAAHLVGAALGAAVGWLLLRKGAVDCEGWDLPSLLAKSRSAPPLKSPTDDPTKPPERAGLEQLAKQRTRRSLKRIRQLLQANQPHAAREEFTRTQHWIPDWRLPRDELLLLGQQLLQAGDWGAAAEGLVEYVDRFPEGAEPYRLTAAELLVERLNRPQAALRLLGGAGAQWSAEDHVRRSALRATALAMIDAGVIEFDRPT